jgi:hypothetical protein
VTQREQANNKLLYYEIAFKRLVRDAENDGVIATVERVPGPGPLAMRNHVAKIEVREKR